MGEGTRLWGTGFTGCTTDTGATFLAWRRPARAAPPTPRSGRPTQRRGREGGGAVISYEALLDTSLYSQVFPPMSLLPPTLQESSSPWRLCARGSGHQGQDRARVQQPLSTGECREGRQLPPGRRPPSRT